MLTPLPASLTHGKVGVLDGRAASLTQYDNQRRAEFSVRLYYVLDTEGKLSILYRSLFKVRSHL